MDAYGGGFGGGGGGGGMHGGFPNAGFVDAEPSQQIMVRNVSNSDRAGRLSAID